MVDRATGAFSNPLVNRAPFPEGDAADQHRRRPLMLSPPVVDSLDLDVDVVGHLRGSTVVLQL